MGPIAKQWEGEGLPSEIESNPLQYRVKIAHQFLITKANYTVALRFQPSGAVVVASQLFRRLVSYAINFNYKLCLAATEVCEEWPKRHLPRKFNTIKLPVAQVCPKLRFCDGLLSSK